MRKFETLTGKVLPLDRPNVDTDAIIPKQYLKSIKRSGFEGYLFDDWRYLDAGDLDTPLALRRSNPDFILNDPDYQGCEILMARENFGCGSSREHAVWALDNYGFRVVIASSFADIFFNNCFKNGVLPIVLDEAMVDRLFAAVAPGYQLTVDLAAQTITAPGITAADDVIPFAVDAARKERLLQGLDDIGLTLKHADTIRAYEAKRAEQAPWLFN